MEDLNKELSLKVIEELVNGFGEHIKEYKHPSYNEATLRIDFLNKFFVALGWDVENNEGLPPSYREVVTEDAVLIEGRPKSPDYSFRLRSGERRFFVEAKKPSVDISRNRDPAFQLRRYGWNADIGISILTNFEYFAVYDCSSKPKETERASFSRIKLIHFKDYIKEFDYIWDSFSKKSVNSDSLQKFQLAKHKKGTLSVDNDFLISLDNWRFSLAKNIFENNKIEEYELNNVVQKILNRITFLRIAEDRNIEHYGKLEGLVKNPNIYNRFLDLCQKANDKFNSGLFVKDELLQNIKLDDQSFSKILKGLYFPISPYEFSVLPVDILGRSYEQFLGKIIAINPDQTLSIEEKIEVKKAGGVYYTPKYIAENIVEETVGKLIKNRKPNEISNLRVLDPACGSGTFCLTAYEYLLKWYKDYYTKFQGKISKKARSEILTPEGELTSKFKGKILLDNIYGVDVDSNAVEVTKLSLLLKCLEGENSSSLKQMSMFQEGILPTIDENIVSGNSIVDFDIYGLSPSLEDDLKIKRKINAFSWEITFKSIFYEGGFDAVIGNPPYIRQELLGEDIKTYLKTKYEVYSGMADLYVYFFEKSYLLLKKKGIFSIIVSNKWFKAGYGQELRVWLKKVGLDFIKDFGDLSVFKKATTYPCIIGIKKTTPNEYIKFYDLIRQGIKEPQEHKKAKAVRIEIERLNDKGWVLTDSLSLNIIDNIDSKSMTLGEYINHECYRGIVTGKNEVFVIDECIKEKLIKEHISSKKIIKPFLEGRDVKAYAKAIPKKYLIFTRRGIDFNKYPAIKLYLNGFKKKLMPKPKNWKPQFGEKWIGRKPGTYEWYEIQDSIEYYKEFEKNKIIYAAICKKPEFTFDNLNFYTNCKCFIIPKDDLLLLGILNSEFAHFWFEMFLPKLRGGFYEPNYVIFKNFPIVKDAKKGEKYSVLNKKITTSVGRLLSLNAESEIKRVERERAFLRNQIDNLVYQFYGLSDKESNHISRLVANVRK